MTRIFTLIPVLFVPLILFSCVYDADASVYADGSSVSAVAVIEEKESVPVITAEDSVRIAVGEEHAVQYTVSPEDTGVVFCSDCDEILVSDDGVITASDEASGTVTVTSGDGRASADIAVESYVIPVESISVREDMIIGVDETVEVSVSVLPENASFPEPVLSSSDESVFVCEGGSIRGISKGEAVLTASSCDGSLTSQVNVTVTRGPYAPLREIQPGRYQLSGETYVSSDTDNSGRARLMLTGDIMCLSAQQNRAATDGTYDFDSSFTLLTDIFAKSDFAIGNLETLLSHSYYYACEVSYANGNPVCNGQSTFLDGLRLAGFDAVVTANNHASDAGRQGVIETVRRLDLYGILHTGTFTDENETRYILADINGIKTAVLSYTTIQNNFWGYNSDEERDYMMNSYSYDRLKTDIADARAAGAEFVIAYNHWGTEYTRSVTGDQKNTAQEMADAGVDLIIGSHTHCLQHAEILEAADGRSVPCVYSMGNFVSSASNDISHDTIILCVDIERENGTVSVADWGYIGCRCCSSYNGGSFVVVPVSPALNGGDDSESLASAGARISEAMGDEIREITEID